LLPEPYDEQQLVGDATHEKDRSGESRDFDWTDFVVETNDKLAKSEVEDSMDWFSKLDSD